MKEWFDRRINKECVSRDRKTKDVENMKKERVVRTRYVF